MQGTPYVIRKNKYDTRLKRYVPGDKILIGERTFASVEVEYDDLVTLTPDEARYVATELWKLAEQIDGKRQKESKIKAIRINTAKIIEQAKKDAEL